MTPPLKIAASAPSAVTTTPRGGFRSKLSSCLQSKAPRFGAQVLPALATPPAVKNAWGFYNSGLRAKERKTRSTTGVHHPDQILPVWGMCQRQLAEREKSGEETLRCKPLKLGVGGHTISKPLLGEPSIPRNICSGAGTEQLDCRMARPSAAATGTVGASPRLSFAGEANNRRFALDLHRGEV